MSANGPVIVLHLTDMDGRTICCGDPWRPVDERYKDVPRTMCCGCRITVAHKLAEVSRDKPERISGAED